MKNFISLLFTMLIASLGFSQSLGDAVRYSSLIPGGTSRVLGAGSSFGAMGADFGVLTINPAGLGDYRNSELMFTFSINEGETKSSLLGNSPLTSQHPNELELENIGMVFNSGVRTGGLKTSNFAIGLNQYNNFSQNFGFEGVTEGTILERFVELGNGNTEGEMDPFEAGLALESGAIFDSDEDLFYETDIDSLENVYKRQDISRSGKINELVFAWGGKFDNNLNLGIALGIPFISFEENKIYQEDDINNLIPIFNDLTFEERLATSGTGINLKLGLGYTIDNTVKLGIAYESPSYYTMTDHFYTALNYDCEVCNFSDETFGSPNGRFKYKLKTPMRVTGSIGALLKSGSVKGFLNVDLEYLNYSNSRFDFTAFSNNASEIDFEREVNSEIDNQLQSTYNLHIGGEMAIDRFRARAGIGFLGSPYFVDGSTEFDKIYSLGVGARGDRFYIDMAYQYRTFSEGYIPYRVLTDSRTQLVNNETEISKVILTLGYKI